MKYPILRIAEDGSVPSKRLRVQKKTRAFSCTLLRSVCWPSYKSGTGKSFTATLRPIFLDYCGTESEHRAFTANLRTGRVASLDGDRTHIELLRSDPYVYAPPQRCEAGIRQIVYLPELFDLDPKQTNSETIAVVVMPPAALLNSVTPAELGAVSAALKLTNAAIDQERARIEAENVKRASSEDWYSRRPLAMPERLTLDIEALCYWALVARELSVRLDARTRFPIPQTPEFRALLLQTLYGLRLLALTDGNPLEALQAPGSYFYGRSSGGGLAVHGPGEWRANDDCGYLAPVALHIEQAKLGELLAELAKDYFNV
ncbi:MAG: hypothetical protein E6Q97_11340 [Desulfurellales bacterium]|nr:MAG: hypothetical protein E6Q97_11340 [Desulfurellales bacterium]